MNEAIIDFERDVIQASRMLPVLVDFWAPWCAPCRTLGPVLEKLAESRQDRFRLVKINTEESPEIADRFQIRSIPDVRLFVNGQVADQFNGALPESAILAWLDRALPSPLKEKLAQAKLWLAAGNRESAGAVLDEILRNDPRNSEATVLKALIQLWLAPEQVAPLLAGIGPDSDFHGEAEGLRALARLFILAVTPEQLPDEPARGGYLGAIERLKAEDYGGALERFVGVVKSARRYDDDGARKACVAIFRLLGENHALTREFRGRLSSALYS